MPIRSKSTGDLLTEQPADIHNHNQHVFEPPPPFVDVSSSSIISTNDPERPRVLSTPGPASSSQAAVHYRRTGVAGGPFSLEAVTNTTTATASTNQARLTVETRSDGSSSYEHIQREEAPSLRDDGDSEVVRVKNVQRTTWATLEELLDRLIFLAVSGDDPAFIARFLLTYRRFTTPRRVLLAMQSRLRQLDATPAAQTDPMLACYAQTRICGLLNLWINAYQEDFAVRGTAGALTALVRSMLSKTYLLHYGCEVVPFLEILPTLSDKDAIWAAVPEPNTVMSDDDDEYYNYYASGHDGDGYLINDGDEEVEPPVILDALSPPSEAAASAEDDYGDYDDMAEGIIEEEEDGRPAPSLSSAASSSRRRRSRFHNLHHPLQQQQHHQNNNNNNYRRHRASIAASNVLSSGTASSRPSTNTVSSTASTIVASSAATTATAASSSNRSRKASMPSLKSLTGSITGAASPAVRSHSDQTGIGGFGLSSMGGPDTSGKKLLKDLVACATAIGEFKAIDIAEEITRYQLKHFLEIETRHWLRMALGGEKDSEVSPIVRFNEVAQHLASWVVSIILCHDKPQRRVQQLVKLVEIAQHLRQQNNYAALRAFVAGINTATFPEDPVMTLFQEKHHASWKLVQSWNMLIQQRGGHQKYRMALDSTKGAAIPALEVHISDLIRAHEANPDFSEEEPHKIHWGKFNLIGRLVLSTTVFQKRWLDARAPPMPAERPTINHLIFGNPGMLMDESMQQLRIEPEPFLQKIWRWY